MSSRAGTSSGFAAQLDALATFVAQSLRTPLPPEADRFARSLLLDSLGALVGGTRYPQVKALRAHLGAGDSGGGGPSFARHFGLGVASTWLDADSGGSFHPQGHRLPPVPTAHPAPHVLPSLLQGAASGWADDDLVRVFAVAVEVGLRFGTATSLRPGMHPHGLHGPVASAVATSLLDGLSADATRTGMVQALCLPVAARLWQPMEGGTVRNAWTGLGAYYGARAATEAPHRTLHPQEAHSALVAAVTDDADLESLGAGLGTRWVFLDSYLKPYACARWVHPALDAFRALARARRDAGQPHDANHIERVEVETFAYAASLSGLESRSDLHARFSVPLCLATLALDGELHAAGFLPEQLARPEVGALARRITLIEEPDHTAALPRERPTTVTVTWDDGDQTSRHVRNARGNPDDPLSGAEVVAKFRANVETVLSPELAATCVKALLQQGDSRALAAVAEAVA